MNFLLELININKYYGKKHVLKNLNLTIKPGEKISLIGGNGSGKSTLSEIIAGIREPSSGKIIMDHKKSVGIQFQENEYPVGVTVKNLIDFYLDKYKGTIPKDELNSMLKTFRLNDLLKKQIIYLSGGQKQRLNIFLAVVHKPDLLILDELSTGLDIKIRKDLETFIIEYLKRNPKIAVLLVTHSMSEVEDLTNRVIVLNWGNIRYDLTLDEINKKYGDINDFSTKIFNEIYEEDLKEGRKETE